MGPAGIKIQHLKKQIISDISEIISSSIITVQCGCGKTTTTEARNLYRKWPKAPYLCKSCSVKTYASNPERIKKFKKSFTKTSDTPEHKLKCSESAKSFWEDPKFIKTVENVKKAVSLDNKTNPLKAAAREKALKTFMEKGGIEHLERIRKIAGESVKIKCKNDPGYIKAITERFRHALDKPESKEKHKRTCIKNWEDPEYRNRMAVVRANQPKVSSLQTTLYSILDDLGVKYFREYPDKSSDPEVVIGPYNFDCVVPRENKPSLLIECQGEYWHSSKTSARNDKSKSSYIGNNFPKQYEVKYFWEHEFSNKNRIIETLKYWLGITELELIDFDFKNITIKECPAKDYRLLLSKYHYLANAGRGGIAYGAYLGDELIGVCVFSPPIRQTVAPSLGYKDSEVRELSRLCVHPKYQKYNFASWFVSRCIKQLDPKYKCIISYCDTTFNHDGAIYKACNFALDGKITPDYWYMDESGWVMHKKTLYQHAVSMKMKEKDYAEKHGYNKIYGQEKLRFVYKR